MNIMLTLIWSEWRRQRKTTWLLLIATVLLGVFMVGMVQFKLFLREIEMFAVALVIGLPFLYCIALGGAFANEFSEKSKSFLLGLPVSRTKIYFAKYLSNLLIFLVLSIVSASLMYRLTDLTPGKAFFDNLGIWTLQTAIIALVIAWILSHATVFFYNLISRNTSSGIIALLTLPIIFVIVSFGTSAITMFFFASDKNWIFAYTLLSSAIIYFFMIGFGCHLWNKRISRDLKTLKQLSISITFLLLISASLYSFNYLYAKYQYESALLEAKESGLELERKLQPAKILDESNGIADLMLFNDKKQRLKYAKINKVFPFYLGANWTDPDAKSYVKLTKQNEAANYILNNPDVQKLYLILEKALSKPDIQYIIQYDKRNMIKNLTNYHQYTSALNQGVDFLLDRAYAQAYLGKHKAFLRTIKQSIKLYNYIDRKHYSGNMTGRWMVKNIYNTIIKAGPEGHAYTNSYIELLTLIKNDKIYNPPYISFTTEQFARYKTMPDFYTNKPILKLGTSICQIPRFRQSFSYWIRSEIGYNNFYLETEKADGIKRAIAKYSLQHKYPPKSFGQFISYDIRMLHYFILRSKIAGDKVCLALKIYRCRYGRYPERLQDLCPEILKELALEPRTEKPYIYKREGKGFLLEGEKDKVLGAIRNPEYYSKTYYMKYQPWNPQGKEKNK